jgi:hypothetical protein
MNPSAMFEVPLTPTLAVSFQRFPYPPTGVLAALPTSCGALPVVGAAAGRFAVPSADREAMWIGLVGTGATAHRVRVRVRVATGDWVDALDDADITVPPGHAVVGIARGDATSWALARHAGATGAPAARRVELSWRAADPGTAPEGSGAHPAPAVHIDLVDEAGFRALGGAALPPLDVSARYGGWRLP